MKKESNDIKIGFGGYQKIPDNTMDIILNSFINDLTATQAASMAKVNRHTANLYYNSWRVDIMDASIHPPRLSGEVEMDQAFFGARKRRRYNDAGKLIRKSKENKVMVFGIIKRNGPVYTHIIKRADRRVLVPIIHMVVANRSKIYTDSWRSFDRLIDSGYKHYVVNHSKGFTAGKGIHINTIENFWSFAKRRLSQFNGISRQVFPLHLKECEFRYNHRKNLEKALKKIII